MFDEIFVRSETGLGAEAGTGVTLTGRRNGAPAAADGARAVNGGSHAREPSLR
jgi:hypothetical protein